MDAPNASYVCRIQWINTVCLFTKDSLEANKEPFQIEINLTENEIKKNRETKMNGMVKTNLHCIKLKM